MTDLVQRLRVHANEWTGGGIYAEAAEALSSMHARIEQLERELANVNDELNAMCANHDAQLQDKQALRSELAAMTNDRNYHRSACMTHTMESNALRHEVQALKAELAANQKACDEWRHACERDRARAESLRADAERYQWLTERNRWYISVLSDLMDRMPKICCIGQDLSAAIDTARAAKGSP